MRHVVLLALAAVPLVLSALAIADGATRVASSAQLPTMDDKWDLVQAGGVLPRVVASP
jgi:hypothetical protein